MSDELDAILAFDLKALTDTQAIDLTGDLIDRAGEAAHEKGLLVALEWCAAIQARVPDLASRATLHYFEANAWSALASVRGNRAPDPFHWSGQVSECNEKQIASLRRAKNGDGFEKLHPLRRCQILTNLGNLLSHVGRFSEAIECFDLALAIDPKFGMAWGNRGMTLTHYVQALPHLPHPPGLCATTAFVHEAHNSLQAALQLPLQGDSIECFRRYAGMIEQRRAGTKEKLADLNSPDLGESEHEREYRRWALSHRLFLNPLNDLGPLSAAAVDVLHPPPITVAIGTGPYFESFFNQIKQEFVSARYLLYEGVAQRQPHFSDAGVTLADTEDYPVFGLAGEKVKLALRSGYSLFDKMAFFLNYYLGLGIQARRVSFRGFWYQSENPKNPLKTEIEGCNNWALRGMHWMAKYLYDSRPEFRDPIEPDAREIDVTRNHAEHKFLAVHDDVWPELAAFRYRPETLPDGAYYAIGRQELDARTLRLMKLARSALIYLAYAIHIEEMRKQMERGSDEKVLSLPARYIDDRDKAGVATGD
jgi:tetratricopeptide (TPR) repeat protein